MEYLMYFAWAYCFIGISKMALILASFPATIRAVNALHEESGLTDKAAYIIHIFALIFTVVLSLFFWWVILYREGWAFFSVYNEEDVVRETIQAIRNEH